jgi:hypothetical protein
VDSISGFGVSRATVPVFPFTFVPVSLRYSLCHDTCMCSLFLLHQQALHAARDSPFAKCRTSEVKSQSNNLDVCNVTYLLFSVSLCPLVTNFGDLTILQFSKD